ncbi:hypothetical protein Zm00014a_011196 [Zea mays]|uniref:Uncharacterized protein n=1 Tax=Zea mays TaxID=4577 RepID=A0A3L6ER95_MAIZE|nr:hypothetical protein Zm00014a_011196 [Zea mays]
MIEIPIMLDFIYCPCRDDKNENDYSSSWHIHMHLL